VSDKAGRFVTPPSSDLENRKVAVKTDRAQAPKQVLSDPPPQVMVACEALEAAGFRIVSDLQVFGKHILIECCLPQEWRDVMTPDNPNYEAIITYQRKLALRSLTRVGFDVDVQIFGWRLVIFLPISRKPKPRGRPRENPSVIEQAKRYLNEGLSYVALAKVMGKHHNEHKSADAWRKLIPHTKRDTPAVKKRK
jgi:hypothetical protein